MTCGQNPRRGRFVALAAESLSQSGKPAVFAGKPRPSANARWSIARIAAVAVCPQ